MLVKICSYLFCVVICLSSCNPSNKEHNTIENKNANLVVHHLKNEETFDAQMIEIDSFILTYGKVASSLDYSKTRYLIDHLGILQRYLKVLIMYQFGHSHLT